MRIIGLNDATTVQEVAEAVAKVGGCTSTEIKVGQLRLILSGVHSVWVQCSLASANKIAGVGRVRVGWVVARATPLTQRPLQCFRCLERGHVRERCTSQVDRSVLRCRKLGHIVKACTAQNGSCSACQAAGLFFGHKIGAPACKAGANKKKVREGKTNPLPKQQWFHPQPGEDNQKLSLHLGGQLWR